MSVRDVFRNQVSTIGGVAQLYLVLEKGVHFAQREQYRFCIFSQPFDCKPLVLGGHTCQSTTATCLIVVHGRSYDEDHCLYTLQGCTALEWRCIIRDRVENEGAPEESFSFRGV